MAGGVSRIIVKNLPKHITDQRFRDHFGKKGHVTDCRLMKTPEGVFRKFGYIGYRTEAEAKASVAYFDNTYLDTSKIRVELAKPIGDSSLVRPWSKHSVGSSAHDKLHSTSAAAQAADVATATQEEAEQGEEKATAKQDFIDQLYAEERTNSKLQEYLQVMAPRSQTKTWANDDLGDKTGKGLLSAQSQQAPRAKRRDDEDDDDEYQMLPTVKVSESSDEDSDGSDDEDAGDSATRESDAAKSDAEYLKTKMVDIDELEAKLLGKGKQEEGESKDVDKLHHQPLEPLPEKPSSVPADEEPDATSDPAQLIAATGRLYVVNLPYSTTEEGLLEFFSQAGPVGEIHIPVDRESKRPKGFAFVKFLSPEHALKAYTDLSGQFFEGRIIRILPGAAHEEHKNEPADGMKSAFKRVQEQKRKAQSGSDFNWNSLYMSADAVAESMANRLQVAKSDLLDRNSDDMAVRLALAETHVINETKQFLEDNGIRLATFGQKARSNTVMLVKNITYGTTVEDLDVLCRPFGELGRIVMPPAGTIAVVEYLHHNDAKNAFRHLAYKRYKSLPLYLEWAPKDCFTSAYDPAKAVKRTAAPTTAQGSTTAAAAQTSQSSKDVKQLDSGSGSGDKADFEYDAEVASVFVKNLNWTTTDKVLLQAFAGVNGVRSAVVKTKANPKNPKERLSLGFGFVEFTTHDAAMRALKTMQGSMLEGHALQLKLSDRQATSSSSSTSTASKRPGPDEVKGSGTKIIIRNVPFEATAKELRQLFSAYAQVKSLRIPRKVAGGHRGFAFVELMTKKDAENAHRMLQNTHLYGRHLVLEWAEDDTSVEHLREKTTREFATAQAPSHKRRKLEMDSAAAGEENGEDDE
ncbi:Multiple RNA-binding domain-containing protein 1 [Sorochytrium milnesiophthora]